jgi:hypothetical protein
LLCSSIKSPIPVVFSVPFFHHVSMFLETEEKKVGVVTDGSPCILSIFQIRLIDWRICLVGVKMWVFSICLWVMQES